MVPYHWCLSLPFFPWSAQARLTEEQYPAIYVTQSSFKSQIADSRTLTILLFGAVRRKTRQTTYRLLSDNEIHIWCAVTQGGDGLEAQKACLENPAPSKTRNTKIAKNENAHDRQRWSNPISHLPKPAPPPAICILWRILRIIPTRRIFPDTTRRSIRFSPTRHPFQTWCVYTLIISWPP
jgi:hypothetical protein